MIFTAPTTTTTTPTASASAAAAAASVAVCAVVASAVWWKKTQHRAGDTNAAHATPIDLLPNECSIVIKTTPSISTITFFAAGTQKDVEAAKEHFEKKTRAIVASNPWLAGRLEPKRDGGLSLLVPTEKNYEKNKSKNANSNTFFSILERPEGSSPLREEDYHTMVQKLQPALCGTTEETLKNPSAPLWKVTFVTTAAPVDGEPSSKTTTTTTTSGFALVVSANHSILDGHGYYRIFNMLSSGEPVDVVSPQRRHDLTGPIKEAMGDEPGFLDEPSLGFILRFVVSMVRNLVFPQTKSIAFVVSKEWIRAQKDKHLQTNDDGAAAICITKPPFVSTNDVVVSSFFRVTDCDLALMAINLRGRVPGCTDDLLGNYEDVLAYCRGDYESPASIRKSISGPPPFQRIGAGQETKTRELPTNWEHFTRCTYAVITNWATFARELKAVVPGDDENNCLVSQTLHLPLIDFPASTPACTYGSMVVFRPKLGEIGILAGGTEAMCEKLKASGMVGSLLYSIK